MKNPKRRIELSQPAFDRLWSAIEAEDDRAIGRMIASMLQELALKRQQAWSEVVRIAEIDEETETARLAFSDNAILVYEKDRQDE
jgi:hypothetical protein